MRHPWPLLALAAVIACGRGDDDHLSPRVRQFILNDPLGDTIASPFAVERAHDVLNFEARPRGDTLLVSVRFANLVQPFSTRASNAVLGIIDLDTDDDASTGSPAVADGFGATSLIGAEWSLFLEDSVVSSRDRRVALQDRATGKVFWIPSSFDGTTVTARVPLALLQLAPGARVRMVGVFGSVERPSDFVPNDGSVLIEMP